MGTVRPYQGLLAIQRPRRQDAGQAQGTAGIVSDRIGEIQRLPLDNSGFDVGIDTRTPVDDSYQLPFRFTGKIDKLTFKLGPSQMSAADKKAAEKHTPKSTTRRASNSS